jgi:hypothetical protein
MGLLDKRRTDTLFVSSKVQDRNMCTTSVWYTGTERVSGILRVLDTIEQYEHALPSVRKRWNILWLEVGDAVIPFPTLWLTIISGEALEDSNGLLRGRKGRVPCPR